MTLRTAGLSDEPEITKLILEVVRAHVFQEYSEEGQNTFLESHTQDKMRERLQTFKYFIAEDKQEIVGVIVFRDSHLFHLFVKSSHHGHGIANKLWQHAKTSVLSNIPKVTVNSSGYAIKFYEKLGFKLLRKEVTKGMVYYPMELSLD